MSKKDKNESNLKYVQKCGGIPKYPHEYHFDRERPKSISDEDIKEMEKNLNEFLSEYGLSLDMGNIINPDG